jgi:CBS domain-containing protein
MHPGHARNRALRPHSFISFVTTVCLSGHARFVANLARGSLSQINDGPAGSTYGPVSNVYDGGIAMKVSKCMTRDVQLVSPTQTIRDAARMMAELDAGALPVQQDDRLVGMITDRDIAVRAVAQGKSPDSPVRDVMSREVLYCFDDQEIEDVARNMGEVKVRRLPVVNRDKRLVGIVSIGDLALKEEQTLTGSAVANISKHGGRHSQVTH